MNALTFKSRLARKVAHRSLVALAISLFAIAMHWLDPRDWDVYNDLTLMLGVVLALVGVEMKTRRDVPEAMPDIVAQDLGMLERCFTILQKQVGSTIVNSERAVLQTVDRLGRVHARSHELHARVAVAVEHSRRLSSASIADAERNGATMQLVLDHQRHFEEALVAHQARIASVVHQVRDLTSLASLISDISRQTNLLAINASIEAARIGKEGNGFKVLATEVRELSSRTAEAARQLNQGITAVANSIDQEMADASSADADEDGGQLASVVEQVGQLVRTLGEVVPYLAELSADMESGTAAVAEDVVEVMGQMQFQDVNRQMLERVEQALESLSEHSAALYALVGGKAPPPPQQLEALMEEWLGHYVMDEQRVAHREGLAGKRGIDARPATELAAVPALPAIELF